ncbi:MAG TPA: DinB family protein [Terriglobales bacterium]|nr:DinB family protein [Terriglobales bacterium]
MLEHIGSLFSYDDWANREVLGSLQALNAPPVRSVELLGHILSTERLWLERLLAEKQTHPVWPLFTLNDCKLEIDQLPGLWKSYLASLGEAGLSDTRTYKNTKGDTFTSKKQDILLHVVMHSAYHRGQIAMDMRAAGFTPAYTDFIHAVRQGFVK